MAMQFLDYYNVFCIIKSSFVFCHNITVRFYGSLDGDQPARGVLLGRLSSSYMVRLGYCSGRKVPVRNGRHRSSASQVGAFHGNDRMTIC